MRCLKLMKLLPIIGILWGCYYSNPHPNPDWDFSTDSPWPAIRAERIQRLLPQAMDSAGVEAWVTLVRENANDPLALHLGGENAGAPAGIIFFRTPSGVRSVIISGFGEAIALRELAIHDSVVVYNRDPGELERQIADRLRAVSPSRIAINSSNSAISDGISWSQRTALEAALDPSLRERLISSAPLVEAWLGVKLPAEIAILKRAASLTAALEEEAYATVEPGVTRDSDIGRYLERRMNELGVTDGWHPAQNPSVNSGPDRGHSHPSDRIIQPGDVIQIDFGIRVHGVWVTDIQRFAYVLKPGESSTPPEIEHRWQSAVAGSRAAFQALKPGATGAAADSAQRLTMADSGSLPVPWGTGHSVGYWAHDAGPGINRRELRTFRPGNVVAFDGFHAWALPGSDGHTWGDGTKSISVEEMAVITSTGAEFLIPPQEQLILIRTRGN